MVSIEVPQTPARAPSERVRTRCFVVSSNPIAGFTEEPRGRDHNLEDWLANLPRLDVAVQQLCILRFLGVIHETKLGDYEEDFKHTPVADGLHGFQQNLSAAEDEIVGRKPSAPAHL